MTGEKWIVIPGWEKFQHRDGFRQRVPTWIKDYTEQTDKDAYLDLSLHQRGLLSDLRREYARTRRQLRGDTASLTRRLGQKVTTASLDALVNAGFIEIVASEPASEPASHVASTEEKRKELPTRRSSLDVGNGQPDKHPPTTLSDHAKATLKQLAGATTNDDDDIPF